MFISSHDHENVNLLQCISYSFTFRPFLTILPCQLYAVLLLVKLNLTLQQGHAIFFVIFGLSHVSLSLISIVVTKIIKLC